MKIDVLRKFVITIIFFAGITVALAATTSFVELRYGGTIRGVGVGIYQDSSCTQPATSVDVGLVDPGSIRNTTVYLRNEGNAPSKFVLQTSNWNPQSASNYVDLTWNYNNQTVGVGQTICVVLSLSISTTIVGITTFSFDAVVTAAS